MLEQLYPYTWYVYAHTDENSIYIVVDGGYGEWVDWTDCNNTCTSNTSAMIRTRYCNSPSASLGGVNCSSYTETQESPYSKY